MSNDRDNATRQIFALDEIPEKFEAILESGDAGDLRALVANLDPEDRDQAIQQMIRQEYEFAVKNGYTYTKTREREFPELGPFEFLDLEAKGTNVLEGIASPQEQSQIDFGPLHFAQSEYEVNKHWFAQGGQGVLYVGRDTALGNREVAIKIVKNPSDSKRFQQEAEITSKLNHPGVAPVYAYATDGKYQNENQEVVEGRPFYAMRLIKGKPFDQCISEFHNGLDTHTKNYQNDPKFTKLIETVISVCNTLSFSHSVGVLHCDIKPQNIMVGEFGDTTVLDWGSSLALPVKKGNKEPSMILCPDWTNESHYTAAYASPEQRNPKTKELTAATDVYSLGATLYQLIVGTAPDKEKVVAKGNITKLQPRCPNRLESICRRAMETDLSKRYSTPAEFASDLTHWLRGEAIQAQPDGPLDKAFRFANRHRAATALSLAILTLIGLVAFFYNASQLKALADEKKLDLGLELVEEICQPLENGEVTSPKELGRVAKLVSEKYDNSFFESHSGDRDKDYFARLLYLRGMVNYFYAHNLELGEEGVNREKYIARSIQHCESALDYFDNSNTEYSVLKRSHIKLFNARLYSDRGLGAVDLENSLRLVKEAATGFRGIGENAETGLRLAESFQLQGETILKLVRISKEYDPSESEVAFKTCIQELMKVRDEEVENKKVRALGRAYGYLGDVQMKLADPKGALESYEESLGYRRQLETALKTAESKRQLAFGYGNFGWMLCNSGEYIRPETVNANAPPTVADYEKVIHTRLMVAIDLVTELAQIGDARSQVELANMNNLIAELYFHAFKISGELPEGHSTLAKALEHIGRTKELLAQLQDSSDAAKRTFVWASVIELQVKLLDSNQDVSKLVKLIREDVEFRIENEIERNDDVLALAIASGTYDEALQKEQIQDLAKRGYTDQWRLERHFRREVVDWFVSAQNSSAEK